MPQIYCMGPTALLLLRRKACWGFFRPKNPTASAGFEPANFGTKGQHATPRPPKPRIYIYIFVKIWFIFVIGITYYEKSPKYITLNSVIILLKLCVVSVNSTILQRCKIARNVFVVSVWGSTSQECLSVTGETLAFQPCEKMPYQVAVWYKTQAQPEVN